MNFKRSSAMSSARRAPVFPSIANTSSTEQIHSDAIGLTLRGANRI
jgi:hypothetical protein